MTDAIHAREILDLQTELAKLRGEEATEQLGRALMDSVSQAKGVLEATAEGAEGWAEKEGEYREALEQVQETLGETSDFIKETLNISKQVSEGLEGFTETTKEVAGVLGEIEDAAKRIEDMKELSEATATEQLRGLSELIGEVTGKLSDLVKLIPGLGAFIEIWRLGIESITTSAAQLESIVLLRNRQAREAGLPEPYEILKSGKAKREARIQEIFDRLEELGVDLNLPAETSAGQSIPADVRNAIKLGLRDAGMTYDEFAISNAALQASRRRVNRLKDRLSTLEGEILVGPATGMTAEGLTRREVEAEQVRQELGTELDQVDDLSEELQPVGDAVTGYHEQYGQGDELEEWTDWTRATYDPSYWMSGAAIARTRSRARNPEEPGQGASDNAEATFDAMAAKAAADAAALEEAMQAEETDFDGDEADDEPAAPGGMSSGTKRAVFIGGGALAGFLIIGAILILPLNSTPGETEAATSSSSTVVQDEPASSEASTSTTAEPTSSTSSTTSTTEAMGASANPHSGAEEHPATTVRAFDVSEGSLVFEVSVNGDGRTMAESPDTNWYQAIFTFSTSDGAFEIRATWSQGRDMAGDVFDKDFAKLTDAVVVGEWTESDTFAITASDYGNDDFPDAVNLEILVRLDGGDEPDTDYGDQVVWRFEE